MTVNFKAPGGDFEADPEHEVVLRATDLDDNFKDARYTVTVTDVDEEIPVTFTGEVLGLIPENDTTTTVELMLTTAGGGVGGGFRYEEVSGGGDNGLFDIDINGSRVTVQFKSGGDGGNFEDAASHDVVLRAIDGDDNFKDATFRVDVGDLAELVEFTPAADLGTIPENNVTATVVSEVLSASGGDEKGFTYTVPELKARDNALFNIDIGDDDRATVKFKAGANYENPRGVRSGLSDLAARNVYEVVLKAEDRDGHKARATLLVTVGDLAELVEFTPAADLGEIPENNVTATVVSEVLSARGGDEKGLFTYAAVAVDDETDVDGDNGLLDIDIGDDVRATVKFKVGANYESPNGVRSSTGSDLEARNEYLVVLSATDRDGHQALATLTVSVTDDDAEDAEVEFDNGSLGEIEENNTVLKLTSPLLEARGGVGGGFTYAPAPEDQGDNALFTITVGSDDKATVGFKADGPGGDFEGKPKPEAVLRATDLDGNFKDARYTVTVTDVDEEIPVTFTGEVLGLIPENDTTTTVELMLTTAGGGVGGGFRYEEVSGGGDNGLFDIDINGSRVTVQFKPGGDGGNFEESASHDVVLRAIDGDGNFKDATFRVDVGDLAEVVEFTPATDLGTIPENNVTATVVSEVLSASGGDEKGFTYTVPEKSAGDNRLLSIDIGDDDRATVKFKAGANYENPRGVRSGLSDLAARNVYEVVLKAEDRDGHKARATLLVTVGDLAELVEFTPAADLGEIPENDAVATVVSEVLSARGGDEKGLFTYAVVPVDADTETDGDNGLLDIDIGDDVRATVKFKVGANYEAPNGVRSVLSALVDRNEYLVVLSATDGDGHQALATLTVTVTDDDAEDAEVEFDNGILGRIPENDTSTTADTSLNARGGVGGGFVYTAAPAGSGNDNGLFDFEFNGSNVTVNFKAPGGDFEADPEHEVVLRATDLDDNFKDARYTVTVTDVDEEIPVTFTARFWG